MRCSKNRFRLALTILGPPGVTWTAGEVPVRTNKVLRGSANPGHMKRVLPQERNRMFVEIKQTEVGTYSHC